MHVGLQHKIFFCHRQKRDYLSRVSQCARGATKNDTAVACYIFNTHEPILIIFLPRDTMLSAVYAVVVCLCVCVCVCVSVCDTPVLYQNG